MRLLPAIILAIAIVLAPVVWFVGSYLLSPSSSDFSGDLTGTAVDSGARIEIEILRQQMEDLQLRLGTVEEELSQLQRAPMAPMVNADPNALLESLNGNQILDVYAQVVQIAGRRKINDGISVAGSSTLLAMFGPPREDLSDDCQSLTNPRVKDLLVLADVGPIRVNLLRPAVESLTRVFERVKRMDVELYSRITSAGGLCVRRIRGSETAVSTHAYGLALDLNIDGVLDTLGDGKTQLGLTILSDFFQEEGWFWGAAFGREDSMHFEVSQEMLSRWRSAGEI
tara:strand:+ start:1545 stop:2393 length:849 start_codon:yes stop_codon:yes gene_type:complete